MSLVAPRKPDQTTREVIVAAQVGPGDTPERSMWTLSIDTFGVLRQEVIQTNPEFACDARQIVEYIELPMEAVQELLDYADAIGFLHFADSYRAERPPVPRGKKPARRGDSPVRYKDGCQVIRPLEDVVFRDVTLRRTTGVKKVQTYGIRDLAASGAGPHATAFLDFWDRIHQFAPFPPRAPSE